MCNVTIMSQANVLCPAHAHNLSATRNHQAVILACQSLFCSLCFTSQANLSQVSTLGCVLVHSLMFTRMETLIIVRREQHMAMSA